MTRHRTNRRRGGIGAGKDPIVVGSSKLARLESRSVHRNVILAQKLRLQLQRACPNCSQRITAGIAVDLADIQFVGERLRKNIRELLRLSFPRDKDRLYKTLAREIEVDLLFENNYHLRSLKKLLPEFWSTLDSRSRMNSARNKKIRL